MSHHGMRLSIWGNKSSLETKEPYWKVPDSGVVQKSRLCVWNKSYTYLICEIYERYEAEVYWWVGPNPSSAFFPSIFSYVISISTFFHFLQKILKALPTTNSSRNKLRNVFFKNQNLCPVFFVYSFREN